MGKVKIGIITAGAAFMALAAGSVPVSALSVFGINVSSSAGSSTPKPDDRMQNGVSDQANNFLNDIVANANENTCLQADNHEYEVCTAYIFNSVFADLVPYYMFAKSQNDSVARLASYRLDSRYTDDASILIRNRVAGWPAGENDVEAPIIKILSVNASLADNSATLRTQETWTVTDAHHNVIYQENNQYHTITMARVQSYLLHKWVVANIE